MKIPVQHSESTIEEKAFSSFIGNGSKRSINVKVVQEKSVEEIDESIRKFAESMDKMSRPMTDTATPQSTRTSITEKEKTISKVEPPKKKIVSCAQSDKDGDERIRRAIEQRKREIEQTKKENGRIIIIIVIAILGAIMLFNAKCSKTRTHHYEHFDPSMEYRHS